MTHRELVAAYHLARWGREISSSVENLGTVKAYVYEVHYGYDIVVNFAKPDGQDDPRAIHDQLDLAESYNHYRASGTLLQAGNRKYLLLETGHLCEYFG